MTGILKRVALGYSVTSIQFTLIELAQQASVTVTLPAGPGEFLGFALCDRNGTALAFNDLKCQIVVDGVIVFDDFLYDLLMITNGNTSLGMFASHLNIAAVLRTVSYAVEHAYESTFTIRFHNDNALTYTILFTVYSRQGA